MIFLAVHDILQPALDNGRVIAGVPTRHGDIDVSTTEVDLRDGGDEVLGIVSLYKLKSKLKGTYSSSAGKTLN